MSKELEISQLKARVARLEECAFDLAAKVESQNSRNQGLPQSYRDSVKAAYALIRETPTQSLAAIQADVLEEMADSGYFNGAAWQIGEMLIDRAGQLRNKAEVKDD